MRYQNLAAFDKHLSEAFPNHISPIYGVVVSCDYDRRKMVKKIGSCLLRKKTESQWICFEAGVDSAATVIEQLNTRSLFGGFSVIFFDGIERLKKDEMDELSTYLTNPSHTSFLILGSATPKNLGELYQKGKKEMVVLDLSDEKPWERQRRLQEWLSEEAKKVGKTLSSDATSYLFEHIGLDLPALHQEVAKLLCYVGDRMTIQKQDAAAICTVKAELTSWQLADGVVWGKEGIPAEKKADLAFILPFIGQLRYQLQVGLQIAELLTKNATSQEISRRFAQLRPQALEKQLAIARQKKPEYFQKGLLALFDFEFSAKSSSIDLGILFDRFLAKLRV
jgi:DNA polymerase-3 subunit delta